MPNIIKNRYVVKSDFAVMIPGGLAEGGEETMELSAAGEDAATEEDAIRARTEEQKAVGDEYIRAAYEQSEAILKDAQLEAARIKQQAREKGYQEAIRQHAGEIESCIGQVNSLLAELQESAEAFLDRYEESFADLVVEAAGKVIELRLSRDDAELCALCKKAVSSVKKADWIQVEVSDQLPRLVGRLREELAQLEGVEVVAKSLPKGACLVQTPDGMIDASVETQLANLRETFEEAKC